MWGNSPSSRASTVALPASNFSKEISVKALWSKGGDLDVVWGAPFDLGLIL